ncbi:hypothetical protein G9A89_005518 [Geosiphon pyriformis]|nr:hypothetical protein G9A89_005518 [Geosiphon pyriformis]
MRPDWGIWLVQVKRKYCPDLLVETVHSKGFDTEMLIEPAMAGVDNSLEAVGVSINFGIEEHDMEVLWWREFALLCSSLFQWPVFDKEFD